MFSDLSRRQLLKLMGGLIVGATIAGSIPFIGKLFTAPVQAQQAQSPVTNPQTLAATSADTREISEAPVTLTLLLTEAASPGPFTAQSLEGRFLSLNIEGIRYNPSNSAFYEIYINLPKGVTPDPNGPHYAGLLSLFALPQGGTNNIPVTDVVRQLQQRNLMTGDAISVTLVPPPEVIAELQRTGRSRQGQGTVRFRRVTITSGSVASS